MNDRRTDVLVEGAGGRARIIEFEAIDATQTRARRIHLEDLDLREGLDLGDIELDSVPSIEFEVVDAKGHPIAGAFAEGPWGQAKTAPTGRDGRGVLHLVTQLEEVWFLAPTYQVQAVAIEDKPLKVVMQRAASLEVRVLPMNGAASSIQIEVSAFKGHILRSDREAYSGLSRYSDIGRVLGSGSGSIRSFERLKPNEGGRILLPDIVPEKPYEIRIYDSLRRPCQGDVTIVVGEAERRVVEIPLEVALGCLQGTVKNASGDPIAEARIEVFTGDDPEDDKLWMETDYWGHFRLEGLLPGKLIFRAYSDGREAEEEVLVNPDGSTTEVEIIL